MVIERPLRLGDDGPHQKYQTGYKQNTCRDPRDHDVHRIELGHVGIVSRSTTHTKERPEHCADGLPKAAFALSGFFEFFNRSHGD